MERTRQGRGLFPKATFLPFAGRCLKLPKRGIESDRGLNLVIVVKAPNTASLLLVWLFVGGAVLQSEESAGTVRLHPEPADSKRVARSRQFDLPRAAPITATPMGLRVTFIDSFGPVLPVELSDLIVVANIATAVTYLTASRTMLYTEYSADVISTLKNDGGVARSKITIIQRGGEGYLPAGHWVKHEVHGGVERFIEQTRNILFLRYRPEADAYEALTAWRSDSGIVQPLLEGDAERAKTGQFEYANMPENRFLAIVSDHIRTEKKPR